MSRTPFLPSRFKQEVLRIMHPPYDIIKARASHATNPREENRQERRLTVKGRLALVTIITECLVYQQRFEC